MEYLEIVEKLVEEITHRFPQININNIVDVIWHEHQEIHQFGGIDLLGSTVKSVLELKYHQVVRKLILEITCDFPKLTTDKIIEMIWDEAKYDKRHHPVYLFGRILLEDTIKLLVSSDS